MAIHIGQIIEIFEILDNTTCQYINGLHVSGKRDIAGVCFYDRIPHGGCGSGGLTGFLLLGVNGFKDEVRPVCKFIVKKVK